MFVDELETAVYGSLDPVGGVEAVDDVAVDLRHGLLIDEDGREQALVDDEVDDVTSVEREVGFDSRGVSAQSLHAARELVQVAEVVGDHLADLAALDDVVEPWRSGVADFERRAVVGDELVQPLDGVVAGDGFWNVLGKRHVTGSCRCRAGAL